MSTCPKLRARQLKRRPVEHAGNGRFRGADSKSVDIDPKLPIKSPPGACRVRAVTARGDQPAAERYPATVTVVCAVTEPWALLAVRVYVVVCDGVTWIELPSHRAEAADRE